MRALAAFLLYAWAASTLAAAPDIQPNSFRVLTEADGISNTGVYSVVQDNLGFMWFCTRDGLDRYDGYNFRIFRPVPGDTRSISDPVCFTLHVDREGNLWAGTKDGVVRYDAAHESFTRFLARETIPLHVYSIEDAEPGALWLTSTEGLIHLDTRTSATRTVISMVMDIESRLLRDKSGTVWLASHRGLMTIAANDMQPVPFPDPRLGHGVVTAMHEIGTGVMWFGTSAGDLYSLSTDRKHLQEYPVAVELADSPISSIVERTDGTLWIGTQKSGLIIYEPDGAHWWHLSAQPNARNGLPSNVVNDLYVDRDNRLWTANSNIGVAVLNPRTADFRYIGSPQSGTAALNGLEAHAVLTDADGRLWVGTVSGVDVFSADLKQVRHYESNAPDSHGFPGHEVSSLVLDQHRHVWVGIYEVGLCEYQSEQDDFKCYKPGSKDSPLGHVGINTFAEDHDGFLWLGVQHIGLYRFDPKTGEFRSFPVNRNPGSRTNVAEIDQVVTSPDGSVWVGTWGAGLYRLDTKTGQFTHISAAETSQPRLPNNDITTLVLTSPTMLWIGTAGGLDAFDTKTGELRSWTIADGLPNDYIDCMVEDEWGKLWVGTDLGLARLDPARGVLDSFQSEDGLPSDEFSQTVATRAPDGTIYMGTLNGVVSFRGEVVQRGETPLQVTLTDLLSDGKRVPIQTGSQALLTHSITEIPSLVLPYTHPHITLGFAALRSPSPAHQRFAYRFHGLDDDWVNMEPGRHSVDYYPQAAGHFVFEVRAVADDGAPTGDSTNLDITVLPAPWLSPLAYTLYALAAFALVLAVLRQLWRTISLERHKHELMRLTESRLQLALRAGRAAAWTADLQGAAIHAPELMAQLGYHDIEGPVMFQAFLQLVHPEDRLVSFGRVFEEALASTGQVDLDFRVRRREGGYVRLQMGGRVVSRDAAGRPLTAAGTFREALS